MNDIEILSIDRVLNKEIFVEKSCRKYVPKASPRPFFILVNNQSSYCMQEVLLQIKYFERGLSKTLKKLTLFFLLNPVPLNGQKYQKQKGPGTVNCRSSGYKTSSQKFLY